MKGTRIATYSTSAVIIDRRREREDEDGSENTTWTGPSPRILVKKTLIKFILT